MLLPLSDGDREWLELLKNGLNGTDRVTCLRIIEAVAPAIARIGGATAIRKCVNAVEDVHPYIGGGRSGHRSSAAPTASPMHPSTGDPKRDALRSYLINGDLWAGGGGCSLERNGS